MAEITSNLRLDTTKPNNAIVWAAQNDSNSRYIRICMYNGDSFVPADQGSTVTLNIRRPDGEQNAYVGVVNSDRSVTVPVPFWALELEGTCTCDISVYNSNRLTTLTFALRVKKSATVPSEIISDESRDIVTALIEDTQEATSDAEAAKSAALTAAQSASSAAASAESKGNAAEEAAGRASASATAADTAAGNAYAATTAANTAAARAEEAAASLEVDLTEIRADIAQNTSDISDLSGRMNTAEEDIADVEDELGLLEPKVTAAEDDIRYLRNSVDELESNKEDSGKKVEYILSNTPADNYPSVGATRNFVNQQIENRFNSLDASDIEYDDESDVGEALDDIYSELDRKQLISNKVNAIRSNPDNAHYPSELAVYNAIQQGGGGTSALMVTFTITGQDAGGNYTGVADKTYSEILAALAAKKTVGGQIALGTETYYSYSTNAGSSTVQFYIAAPGVIYSLAAEYSESGGTEQGATFTAYAYTLLGAGELAHLWSMNRYVIHAHEAQGAIFSYNWTTSLFSGSVTRLVAQLNTRNRKVMILRDLYTGNIVDMNIEDLYNTLNAAGVPCSYGVATASGANIAPNDNVLTFELPNNTALVYDSSSNGYLVIANSPFIVSETQAVLFAHYGTTSTAGGLFVDYTEQVKGRTSGIVLPTLS